METPGEPVVNTYPSISQSVGIIGIMIAAMLLALPIFILLPGILGREPAMFLYYLSAMGITIWIINTSRWKVSGELSFVLSINHPQIIPLIVITTIALIFGVISPLATLIPMPDYFKEVFSRMAGDTGVFAFGTIVIAAPILEELIFRGIMLDGLLKKYTPARSIIISSLLFGLVHLNPWQFISAFIIGTFSGWVYYRTRSLIPSIIIHFTANLLGFSVRLFLVEDDLAFDQTIFDIYDGLTNLILVVTGSLVAIVGCIYLLKNQFRNGDQNPPDQSDRYLHD